MTRNQDSAKKTRKPGMKLPVLSLKAPTTRGDINAPTPEVVIIQPQTIATFCGVIPGSSIGSVMITGEYSHEPSPTNITAAYNTAGSSIRNEPRPPSPTITPGTTKKIRLGVCLIDRWAS